MHTTHKDQNSFYSQIEQAINLGVNEIYNKLKSIGIIVISRNFQFNKESTISIRFSSGISDENKRKYIMIIMEVIESYNRKDPNDIINDKSELRFINISNFIDGKEIEDLNKQLDNYLVSVIFNKFDVPITIGTSNLRYQSINNFTRTYLYEEYTMMAMNFLSIKSIMDSIYNEISKIIKEEK